MTSVYKLFDADGQWLYVGISDVLTARLTQHAAKAWFSEVASATFEHFEERRQALDRERELIKAHRPIHNIHHKYPNKVACCFNLRRSIDDALRAHAKANGITITSIVHEAVAEFVDRRRDVRAA